MYCFNLVFFNLVFIFKTALDKKVTRVLGPATAKKAKSSAVTTATASLSYQLWPKGTGFGSDLVTVTSPTYNRSEVSL